MMPKVMAASGRGTRWRGGGHGSTLGSRWGGLCGVVLVDSLHCEGFEEWLVEWDIEELV